MKVAACQVPDIRDDVPHALSVVKAMASEASKEGADLVLFPECFLQGYFTDPSSVERLAIGLGSPAFGAVLDELSALDGSVVVVVGLIEADARGFYNTAVVIQNGTLLGRYRKTHLLGSEKAAFTPGAEYPVFEAAGTRFGINICYDLNFQAATDALSVQGAQALVCPCNNMLPWGTAQKYKTLHNPIRAQRAKAAGVWLVSSDVTGEREGRISYGPTAFIDPNGAVVAQVPLGSVGTVMMDVT